MYEPVVFVFFIGGCGAMYEVHVESMEFKGKRTIQQHQLVNQVNDYKLCFFADVTY